MRLLWQATPHSPSPPRERIPMGNIILPDSLSASQALHRNNERGFPSPAYLMALRQDVYPAGSSCVLLSHVGRRTRPCHHGSAILVCRRGALSRWCREQRARPRVCTTGTGWHWVDGCWRCKRPFAFPGLPSFKALGIGINDAHRHHRQ